MNEPLLQLANRTAFFKANLVAAMTVAGLTFDPEGLNNFSDLVRSGGGLPSGSNSYGDWKTLPGGLIVQRGRIDTIAGPASAFGSNVSQNVTFPNNDWTVWWAAAIGLSVSATGYPEGDEMSAALATINNNGCTFKITRIAGSNTGAEVFDLLWIAVGIAP